MSVYKKLQEARMALQSKELKKSGHNKFSNYYYFELGDFLPTIQTICSELGLCGVVSFTEDTAYLTIHDTDGDGFVTFTSPMSSASLKGCHNVQNLGAVQTYLRRYLWVNAFEIVEHDALDSVTGADEPKKLKPAEPFKQQGIVEPKPAKVVAPKESVPATLQGKEGDWQLKVLEDNGDWGSAVKTATEVLLQFAKDETDVQNIFKTNRTIYDKLKAEHEQVYAEIMATFKATKEALTKE